MFACGRERNRRSACGQRFAPPPSAADCPPADHRSLSLERVLWSRTPPARAWGGFGGSGDSSCLWKGEESTVPLRPALRSTAFGGGLSSGGPSIPLPRSCSVEPNTARPGLVGVGGRIGERVARLRRRTAPSGGPSIPLLHELGNSLTLSAHRHGPAACPTFPWTACSKNQSSLSSTTAR